MKKRARIIWRVAVLSVGLMYSLILWHQQVLNQVLAAQDQQKLLDKSNSHSDEEIGTVRGDVRVLQHDLKQTASKNDVTQTATVITGILTKSQQDLNEKLEKLKPVTPEIADVRFSLFTDTVKTSDPPILNTAIKAQKDGTFPVDVFFTNVSGTSVEAMDVWITLCPLCFFASELPGFDRPAGTDEQTRHLIIPLLNPGTSYPKITILVKSNLKPPFSFWVNFRHACKVCGKNPDQQVLRIAALPMPLS
jgi:hypothetical protein